MGKMCTCVEDEGTGLYTFSVLGLGLVRPARQLEAAFGAEWPAVGVTVNPRFRAHVDDRSVMGGALKHSQNAETEETDVLPVSRGVRA